MLNANSFVLVLKWSHRVRNLKKRIIKYKRYVKIIGLNIIVHYRQSYDHNFDLNNTFLIKKIVLKIYRSNVQRFSLVWIGFMVYQPW